jgi:hypothetical protein
MDVGSRMDISIRCAAGSRSIAVVLVEGFETQDVVAASRLLQPARGNG